MVTLSLLSGSLLVPFSPLSFIVKHCGVEKPLVLRLPASPKKVDPLAPLPAADPVTPPRPISLLAPPWLLPDQTHDKPGV